MNNKFFIVIIFLMLFWSDQLLSQESTSKKDSDSTVRNYLKSGKFAIQFGIGSDFVLTNFEGAVLSVKYQFSPKTALRGSFYGSYDEFDNDDSMFVDNTSYSIGGNLIFMYYLNPKDAFNIYGYLGGQYYTSFGSREDNGGYTEVTEWTIGPVLGAGAEYFIFKQFSVFAEYSYSFRFGKLKQYLQNYYPPYSEYDWNFDITRFQSNNVNFGVSVYF